MRRDGGQDQNGLGPLAVCGQRRVEWGSFGEHTHVGPHSFRATSGTREGCVKTQPSQIILRTAVRRLADLRKRGRPPASARFVALRSARRAQGVSERPASLGVAFAPAARGGRTDTVRSRGRGAGCLQARCRDVDSIGVVRATRRCTRRASKRGPTRRSFQPKTWTRAVADGAARPQPRAFVLAVRSSTVRRRDETRSPRVTRFG